VDLQTDSKTILRQSVYTFYTPCKNMTYLGSHLIKYFVNHM